MSGIGIPCPICHKRGTRRKAKCVYNCEECEATFDLGAALREQMKRSNQSVAARAPGLRLVRAK